MSSPIPKRPDMATLKDLALELFIAERCRVAEGWGISLDCPISSSTLQGIDAEANERIRIRLLDLEERVRQADTRAFNEAIDAALETILDEEDPMLQECVAAIRVGILELRGQSESISETSPTIERS